MRAHLLVGVAVVVAAASSPAQTPVEAARALVARYHEDATALDRARDLLDAALTKDRQVETMVTLSYVQFLLGDVRATTSDEKLAAYDRGRELGKRAVELAPKSHDAHLWYAITRRAGARRRASSARSSSCRRSRRRSRSCSSSTRARLARTCSPATCSWKCRGSPAATTPKRRSTSRRRSRSTHGSPAPDWTWDASTSPTHGTPTRGGSCSGWSTRPTPRSSPTGPRRTRHAPKSSSSPSKIASSDRCRHPPAPAERAALESDRARRRRGARSRSVPRADRLHPVASHPGHDHRSRVRSPVRGGGGAGDHAGAGAAAYRTAHLSGRLLPHEGARHSRHLPGSACALRRPRARHDRRAPHAQRGGTQDGEPGRDDGLRQAGDLCGHPRAPHLQSAGLREDPQSRGDRDGAPGQAPAPLLDRLQRPPRLIRPERLHADLSPLFPLPRHHPLPPRRRDDDSLA